MRLNEKKECKGLVGTSNTSVVLDALTNWSQMNVLIVENRY